MAQVSARIEVPASVHEVQTAWYDTERWPRWVDQLAEIVEVASDWPSQGSAVVWESGPAGRGRVTERVVEYEPLQGLTAEVEDASITGTQRVSFDPRPDGAEVELTLDYKLKRRTPLSALVDVVFIRRLMGASLARTLSQFRVALQESHEAPFE